MRDYVTFLLCGLVICGWAVPAARACEEIDNPMYKHWARFKPGAFSEYKTIQTNPNGDEIQKSITTIVTTLMAITPEKAVVETRLVNITDGRRMEMPVRTYDVPAKIEETDASKPHTLKKGDKIEGAEVVGVSEGEEEIKIGDRKIKCKWAETKTKDPDSTVTTTKIWSSDDVPDRAVKDITTREGKEKVTIEGSLIKYDTGGAHKTEPPASGDKGADTKNEAGHQQSSTEKKGVTENKERAVPERDPNVDRPPVRSEEGVTEKGLGD